MYSLSIYYIFVLFYNAYNKFYYYIIKFYIYYYIYVADESN